MYHIDIRYLTSNTFSQNACQHKCRSVVYVMVCGEWFILLDASDAKSANHQTLSQSFVQIISSLFIVDEHNNQEFLQDYQFR